MLAAGLLGAATVAGVLLTSALQGQLKYALPLSGGVTLYVAATDLLPEVNREPNWRMALLAFVGVVSLLFMEHLSCVYIRRIFALKYPYYLRLSDTTGA